MLVSLVVIDHAVQRKVVDCYGLFLAEGDWPADMHMVHLSEAFQDLRQLKVILVDSGSVDVLEAPLVFLDILVEEKLVQVFFCFEVEVGKAVSDCEICVLDLDHSLNVRFPVVFELLLSLLGLWLSEDVRAEDADCILMPDALSFHELESFLLLVIQSRFPYLQKMFDESVEKSQFQPKQILLAPILWLFSASISIVLIPILWLYSASISIAISARHAQFESFFDQSLCNIPHHIKHLPMCLKLYSVTFLLIVV